MVGTPLSGNPSAAIPRRRIVARLIFRIVRWTTYAAALITVLMVFHAVPPPAIATSAQAAARAEQKMQDVQRAVAGGQSATLRLDQTELNSYLATHLDISTNSPSSNPAAAPVP